MVEDYTVCQSSRFRGAAKSACAPAIHGSTAATSTDVDAAAGDIVAGRSVPRTRPIGYALLQRPIGDRHPDGGVRRRAARRRLLERRGWLTAIRYRDAAGDRRHRVSPRPRRGGSAAVADRRSLRRLSRRSGVVAGGGSAPPRDHRCAGRSGEAGRASSPETIRASACSKGSSRKWRCSTATVPDGIDVREGAVALSTSIHGTDRRPGCSSISVKTAKPRRATRAADCWMPSATTAASRWRSRRVRLGTGRRYLGRGRGAYPRERREQRDRQRQARAMNVFDELRELERTGTRFDTIVLDPPAFAKNKASVRQGDGRLQGNQPARAEAARARRLPHHLQLLVQHQRGRVPGHGLVRRRSTPHAEIALVEKRTQGRDHPILMAVPETYYLKCLILRKLA